MDWRVKAAIQQAVSVLPASVADRTYYGIQRRFGALREDDPIGRIGAAKLFVALIEAQGQRVDGRTFLEIGTGRRLNLPIALWLYGAAAVTTVDLNPLLRAELVAKDIAFLRDHAEQIREIFADRPDRDAIVERLRTLLDLPAGDHEALLETTNISYLAPADARSLGDIADASIDFHVSFTTAEHIPPDVLRAIFAEGRRVIRPDGLFVFDIDMSDHFSHSDRKITSVNFLRFSESGWARRAGNRYMYHNRLRIDELEQLLADAGLDIVSRNCLTDRRSLAALQAGLPLDERFAGKPPEINAVTRARIVARAR
jgi:SAM-dependent methyltransferase